MFFLGLLSTPLPYLLLAAFYFFGFAMGMFNNSNGDENTETLAAATIQHEVKQKAADQNVFYYQINTHQNQIHSEIIIAEDSVPFLPDSGPGVFLTRNVKVHEFLHSGFQFSRPPPTNC